MAVHLRLALSLTPVLWLATWSAPAREPAPRRSNIELKRVPDNGIQPQIAIDRGGTVHLVYFKGDPAQGDLFYTHSSDGQTFSPAIRVNSDPGTAVALGNIRGARIAAGRNGNIFVVWNGSSRLGNPALGRSPMLFSRLSVSHSRFEPERNLIHTAYGIDGGGAVAADADGRVYVFWHAPIPGREGEASRRVWISRSTDDGVSFQPERIAWDNAEGACDCCSLNAYLDPSGPLYVLFRSAEETVHRDMMLLASTDHGASFKASDISPWNVGYCVMSSEAFTSGAAGTFGAWETEKQIHFGHLDPANAQASSFVVANGPNQKYPSLAQNRDGVLLVSWTEGMGWKKGGSLHWQMFQRDQPIGPAQGVDGVPAWSVVASYARPNGSFVVLY